MSVPSVLVIDDDAPIRFLIGKVLERSGISVTLARDGAEAIRLFSAGRYDVIVLDLMMPTMTGHEVLDYIEPRLDENMAIVVVTASGDKDLAKLRGRRVHSIIRKPFDVLRLATTIREVATAIQATKKPVTRDVEVPPPMEAARPLDPIC